MELFLVRHTHVAVEKGICYGISDVPLSSDFETETNEVLHQLFHLDNPSVYSSPLKRCAILAEKLSTNVIYDTRLKELNFGKWEMKPWGEIYGPEADQWMKNFVTTKCPGGESFIDLSVRVRSFVNDLSKTNHHNVVVVTHGGIIRTILAWVQGIPLEKSFNIEVCYGQVFTINSQDLFRIIE